MLAARHRLFVRVLGLLADLAAEAPLVLVLEDLHWADESSRELLAFLAVRLRQAPVLVAATLREDGLGSDAQRWLTELERRPAVVRLRLARLADAEIAELVTGNCRPAPARTRWRPWSRPPKATRCTPGSLPAPARMRPQPRSPTRCWPRRPALTTASPGGWWTRCGRRRRDVS